MSLRGRIALVAGIAVAVAVAGVAAGSYAAVRSQLRGEIDDSLRDRAQFYVHRPEQGRGRPDGGPQGEPRHEGGGPGRPPGPPDLSRGPAPAFGGAAGYVQVVSADGSVAREPGETSSLPVQDRARDIARRGLGSHFTDMHVKGTHVRVLTTGIGSEGAVQVARPLDEVDHTLSRLALILVVSLAAGIALAVALGAGVARAALEPIRRFTNRTETLSAGLDLSERIEADGKDELARLAHSFNTTLDSLERSVQAQRHLVADASHELRTPIASLRANIQVLEEADRLPKKERESLRTDIIEELDELTSLVSDVVELARGAKAEEELDEVRLDRIVEAVVDRARRRAIDGNAFRLQLEPTVVEGEPERIGRAVSNLLDNARKWSPPGGAIEVELAGGTLTVRDHGPGFDDEDLPHVFDRFYRAKDARGRPGSGLGLAIVRHAAEAHGGKAAAANAPDGGAVLRVSFGQD
ncbi:MAG TPA: HAMP domain-containing sensor histidine kinase [Thermoleophilaceae bacterium]|nr:HAMP domain-containing sensor histidine kinase [Thermoleophilaceae bacterium]